MSNLFINTPCYQWLWNFIEKTIVTKLKSLFKPASRATDRSNLDFKALCYK